MGGSLSRPQEVVFDRQGVFRFLHLPAEIRNQVYGQLTWETDPNLVLHKANVSHRFDIAILLVNRQVTAEAIDIFYQQLTLRLRLEYWEAGWFQTWLAPYPNLRRIGVQVSARDFDEMTVVYYAASSSDSAFRRCVRGLRDGLGKMRDLEVLEIEYVSFSSISERGRFKLCPDNVMECFKSLRGLKKVSIVGDLDEEYAQEIVAAMTLPKSSTLNDNAVRPERDVQQGPIWYFGEAYMMF